jgi:hypothetical protein
MACHFQATHPSEQRLQQNVACFSLLLALFVQSQSLSFTKDSPLPVPVRRRRQDDEQITVTGKAASALSYPDVSLSWLLCRYRCWTGVLVLLLSCFAAHRSSGSSPLSSRPQASDSTSRARRGVPLVESLLIRGSQGCP